MQQAIASSSALDARKGHSHRSPSEKEARRTKNPTLIISTRLLRSQPQGALKKLVYFCCIPMTSRSVGTGCTCGIIHREDMLVTLEYLLMIESIADSLMCFGSVGKKDGFETRPVQGNTQNHVDFWIANHNI